MLLLVQLLVFATQNVQSQERLAEGHQIGDVYRKVVNRMRRCESGLESVYATSLRGRGIFIVDEGVTFAERQCRWHPRLVVS